MQLSEESAMPETRTEMLPVTARGRITIAASGDMIGPKRPISGLGIPGLDEVFDRFRRAQVGFANHEGSAFDLASFEGVRAAENGGGYPLNDPASAGDLPKLGINLMSCANNHAADWGLEGLLATSKTLSDAGVVHAGTGRSLAAAQQPAFLETPNGRVALVSLATTFTAMSRAGDAGGVFRARPGLFAYRVSPVSVITPEEFEVLQRVARRQGSDDGSLDGRSFESDDALSIGGERFALAADDREPGLDYEVNATDHADLLRAVRYAKQVADLVIVAVHSHETESGSGLDMTPPKFLQRLYRESVDAGADVAVTTGPHELRGMEIYRGKPIFYGLGSLVFEMETGYGFEPDTMRAAGPAARAKTPGESIHDLFGFPDSWYDGAVVSVDFADGELAEVRVHPHRLSRNTDYRVMGYPSPARGDDATRILTRFAEASAAFGVELRVEGDEGVVRVSTAS